MVRCSVLCVRSLGYGDDLHGRIGIWVTSRPARPATDRQVSQDHAGWGSGRHRAYMESGMCAARNGACRGRSICLSCNMQLHLAGSCASGGWGKIPVSSALVLAWVACCSRRLDWICAVHCWVWGVGSLCCLLGMTPWQTFCEWGTSCADNSVHRAFDRCLVH